MRIPLSGSLRLASIVGVIHLALAVLTAVVVHVMEGQSGQAIMVWAPWAIIDIPISLIAYIVLSGNYLVIHGVIGSLWWFFLVAVISSGVRALRNRQRVR